MGSRLLISYQCALSWRDTRTSQLGLSQAGELGKPQDPLPLNTPAPWTRQLQPLCLPAACSEAVLGLGGLQMLAGGAGNRLCLVPGEN